MNSQKIEELVKDIRVDACKLFNIHHPLLDSGFQPSKDIIQLCDDILSILKKQYFPLGQEPVNRQCLSCGLNCPNDCPLDKEQPK